MGTDLDCSMMLILFGVAAFWLALLTIGIIASIKGLGGLRKDGARRGLEVAEQILAARFARGDISLDEYRQRLGELRQIDEER
jgi:putative membrane protein